MKNYSQNNEQEIILKYFGDFKGRFIDIGAYNGVDLSNTRALLELGWNGVLVEPNPFNLVDLINNCKEFGDRAVIYCAGAGGIPDRQRLRLDETPGRGWAASFIEKNPGVMIPSNAHVIVPIIPVWEFIKNPEFHFLSIDAEWMDDDILSAFTPLELGSCRMIIIEPSGREQRTWMYRLLEKRGFKVHAETPENIIAVKA